MSNQKISNFVDVIEMQLRLPLTNENAWLILRHLSTNQYSLFMRNTLKLIEKSSKDYTEEINGTFYNCLFNEPEIVGNRKSSLRLKGVKNIDGNCNYLTCTAVEWKGKTYSNFIDHHHMYEYNDLQINLHEVFIETQAITWLKDLFNSNNGQQVKKAPVLNIIEQRLEALEAYLKTRTFDKDKKLNLQQRYEAIGSPNKEELWEQMYGVIPRLFSAGKDDFYKADFFNKKSREHQITIKITKGRPPKNSL